MHKKSLLGAAVCTLALMGMTTAPASAAGQVERGPEHANSICSFSGLNDGYVPGSSDPEHFRVQSYGQIIRIEGIGPAELKAMGETPAALCNGSKLPWQDVPDEPVP